MQILQECVTFRQSDDDLRNDNAKIREEILALSSKTSVVNGPQTFETVAKVPMVAPTPLRLPVRLAASQPTYAIVREIAPVQLQTSSAGRVSRAQIASASIPSVDMLPAVMWEKTAQAAQWIQAINFIVNCGERTKFSSPPNGVLRPSKPLCVVYQ